MSDLISRDAVLDALAEGYYHSEEDYRTAVNMVGTVPTHSQRTQRVDDLISRQAVLDIFDDFEVGIENGMNEYEFKRKELLDLPSADRKGQWEMKTDPYGFFKEIPVCSECGHTTEMRKTYNFCPNCGADMRKKDGVTNYE